jgi:hypothetical protein
MHNTLCENYIFPIHGFGDSPNRLFPYTLLIQPYLLLPYTLVICGKF